MAKEITRKIIVSKIDTLEELYNQDNMLNSGDIIITKLGFKHKPKKYDRDILIKVSDNNYCSLTNNINLDDITDEQLELAIQEYLKNNPVETITDEEVTNLIKEYLVKNPPSADGLTQEDINNFIREYLEQNPPTDTKLTQEDINNFIREYLENNDITSGNNQGGINNEELTKALKNYVKITELNNTLSLYVKASDLTSKLNDYVKKTDLQSYAKKTDLENFVTNIDLQSYVTNENFTNTISNFVTSPDLQSYVKREDGKGLSSNDFTSRYKEVIDTIPNNAQFTDTTYTAGKGLSLSNNQFDIDTRKFVDDKTINTDYIKWDGYGSYIKADLSDDAKELFNKLVFDIYHATSKYELETNGYIRKANENKEKNIFTILRFNDTYFYPCYIASTIVIGGALTFYQKKVSILYAVCAKDYEINFYYSQPTFTSITDVTTIF